MDSLITQPVTLLALAAAIVVTAYEMRTSLQPGHCSECPRCRAVALADERRQRELQDRFAREHNLDKDDDDRRIG
jgi:hypothetical protein